MKYFVSSDIHSGYTEWMKALNEAGFDENDDNHKIILCGDAFDRLDETNKVYDFIMDMKAKDKIIYIMGNHELLLNSLINKFMPASHDYSNGTVKSLYHLAGMPYDYKKISMESFYAAITMAQDKVSTIMKSVVPYYETKNYIFVHSWIPYTLKMQSPKEGEWVFKAIKEYKENWRDANLDEWEEATWTNPWHCAFEELNKTGKTLVFGHWNTSFYRHAKGECTEYGPDANFDTVIDDTLHIVGLDACTAHSHQVNVYVVEDEEDPNYER